MPKQCSYHNKLGERCLYLVPRVPDYSHRPIISRKLDPNNYNNPDISLQVFFPTQSHESDLCYYHNKLIGGYLNDSRGQSPNKAYQKREAMRKAEKEAEKDMYDNKYPPAKQVRMFEYEEGI